MKYLLYCAVAALLPTGMFATSASAATIIEVTGGGTTGATLNDNSSTETEVAGTLLEIDGTYENVSINVEVSCILGDCSGDILLTSGDIFGTTSILDVVAGDTYSLSSGGFGLTLDIGDLFAGEYYLLVGMTAGLGGWIGSDPATITGLDGPDVFADSASFFLPDSTFTNPAFGTSQLNYTVTGDRVGVPLPVPLPASGFLLLAGFGFMASLRARKIS